MNGTGYFFTSLTDGPFLFGSVQYHSANVITFNFGQDSSFAGTKTPQANSDSNGIGDFFYAPPNSYLALCTANLPSVDVIPSEHFQTRLITGTGASNTQVITGFPFAPDFVWIKNRSSAYNHAVYDTVRGASNRLYSNLNNAEASNAALSAFSSEGYTVGTDAANENNVVSWNWKAGGSASSNTNGSITSSVSANPSAGFSIVSWTSDGSNGLAVGHGLASAPQLIIYKPRNAVGEWYTWLNALVDSSQDYVRLNDTAAKLDIDSGVYGVPSSTLISNFAFTNTTTLIAYCFHSVDGYSKVGSYTGNGSTDGTFVHCGFRPAYVMIKCTDTAGTTWWIEDTKRDTYNPQSKILIANGSDAEASLAAIDTLSNGFKFRHTSSDINGSGKSYIFLAFAESPFKHSNAR